jgi:hypothetical protein
MSKAPRKQTPNGLKNKVKASKPGRRSKMRPLNETETLPDYLKDYDGRGQLDWNIDHEDFAWVGDDGSLNSEAILKERGYERESPLWFILQAIIAAHPDGSGRSPDQRIELAEGALLGEKRKRGNDEKQDEELLCEIGRRFFRLRCEHPDLVIEVGPIAKEVLADPRFAHYQQATTAMSSQVRRLQRKFKADPDYILAMATSDHRWHLPEFYLRIRRIIADLRSLGVNADDSLINARIRSREPKPSE